MYTVKQARTLGGFTQVEVAKALGVHVNTYQRVEQHPEKATIEFAKAFSQFVKIPLDDISFFAD